MGIFENAFGRKKVQDTSKEAYENNEERFVTLGDRIVNHLKSVGIIMTRAELAEALAIPTATMSGRINDLLKKGRVIEEPGRFTCGVTGNRVRGVSAA